MIAAPKGRLLLPVSGRCLIYASSLNVEYISKDGTQVIPLFSKRGESGRFVVEMDAYLTFPIESTMFVVDTLHFFQKLELPERYTPSSHEVTAFGTYPVFSLFGQWTYGATNFSINSSTRQAGTRAFVHMEVYIEFTGPNGQYSPLTSSIYYPTRYLPATGCDFLSYYADIYLPAYQKMTNVHHMPKDGMTLTEVLDRGWFAQKDTFKVT